MKASIQLITAAVLSIGGLVLLFCGAFIAPQGEIHAGALFGIDYTYKWKSKHGGNSDAAN